MNKKYYNYIGSCRDFNGRDITNMVDLSRTITYKTFLKHVGGANVAMINNMLGYSGSNPNHIKNDYHITYHKSSFRGKMCVYLVWSAYEYIFVKKG